MSSLTIGDRRYIVSVKLNLADFLLGQLHSWHARHHNSWSSHHSTLSRLTWCVVAKTWFLKLVSFNLSRHDRTYGSQILHFQVCLHTLSPASWCPLIHDSKSDLSRVWSRRYQAHDTYAKLNLLFLYLFMYMHACIQSKQTDQMISNVLNKLAMLFTTKQGKKRLLRTIA